MNLNDILNLSESDTKNPHCKAREGERKVKDHKDYAIFHHRGDNEHRGVLKLNSEDDGAFEEKLVDCVDTMNATVKRLNK